jgi:hypothetical protein
MHHSKLPLSKESNLFLPFRFGLRLEAANFAAGVVTRNRPRRVISLRLQIGPHRCALPHASFRWLPLTVRLRRNVTRLAPLP